MTAEGSISITWKLDDNAESWAFPWAYLINLWGEGVPSNLLVHPRVCVLVCTCVFPICVLTGPLGDSDARYCLRALVYLDFQDWGPSYPFKASQRKGGVFMHGQSSCL